MALPDSWLDHLFGRLAVRYGAAWLAKWDGIPMASVRADWAEVLDGVSGDAIRYGLQYLPDDFPPTATAFKALCDRRPIKAPMLPEPAMLVNHEAVARIRAQVSEIASAGLVREREREARERQKPASHRLVAARDTLWPPQGPLPWPQGVTRPDHDDQAGAPAR